MLFLFNNCWYWLILILLPSFIVVRVTADLMETLKVIFSMKSAYHSNVLFSGYLSISELNIYGKEFCLMYCCKGAESSCAINMSISSTEFKVTLLSWDLLIS